MNLLVTLSQITIAASIVVVWVFRFDNIVKEFKHYGLSDLTRNIVGATKIALSTLLIAGIWFPSLILIPSLGIVFLMICAQFIHFKVKNPLEKFIPSFLLLILSLFIAATQMGLI